MTTTRTTRDTTANPTPITNRTSRNTNRAGIRMPRAARLDDRSEFKTPSEGPQSARFLRAGDVH